MARTSRYLQDVRDRAARLVLDHRGQYPSEWQGVTSIAPKVGGHPETPRLLVRRTQIDKGERPGLTTEERERLMQLERENRELRRANEILKSAAAFFGAELDGRHPRGPSTPGPPVGAGESSRSAACCSSPPRRITRRPRGHRRRVSCETSSSSPRSPGSGPTTDACTELTRCGPSSAGKATPWHAAPWNG